MLVSGGLVSYAAASRDGRLVVLIDQSLSLRHQKLALLRALTDDEYEAYELTLPVAEQHRRQLATAQWRDLSRRRAMLTYVKSMSDEEYAATVPETEVARRRSRRLVTVPEQSGNQVAV
jgi:hypothetical protein